MSHWHWHWLELELELLSMKYQCQCTNIVKNEIIKHVTVTQEHLQTSSAISDNAMYEDGSRLHRFIHRSMHRPVLVLHLHFDCTNAIKKQIFISTSSGQQFFSSPQFNKDLDLLIRNKLSIRFSTFFNQHQMMMFMCISRERDILACCYLQRDSCLCGLCLVFP